MTRSSQQRLRDILDAIAAIGQAERLMGEAEVTQDEGLIGTAYRAVLYQLVVIGEAVKALTPEIHQRHPEVPWTEIARMRDLLAHQYFRVSRAVVMNTIDRPMAALREACLAALARIRPSVR